MTSSTWYSKVQYIFVCDFFALVFLYSVAVYSISLHYILYIYIYYCHNLTAVMINLFDKIKVLFYKIGTLCVCVFLRRRWRVKFDLGVIRSRWAASTLTFHVSPPLGCSRVRYQLIGQSDGTDWCSSGTQTFKGNIGMGKKQRVLCNCGHDKRAIWETPVSPPSPSPDTRRAHPHASIRTCEASPARHAARCQRPDDCLSWHSSCGQWRF